MGPVIRSPWTSRDPTRNAQGLCLFQRENSSFLRHGISGVHLCGATAVR
jgi:hypothetical protein